MKNFIVAVCLLALAVIMTGVNSLIVQKQIASLTELASLDDAAAAEEELSRLEPYLALTVNHIILENVQTAASDMRVYRNSTEPGAHTEYLAAKARFLSACREISEGEKFTISNIF